MFRPRQSFIDTLTRLGLTNGLKLCLDAGDAASYTSGQKWLDRSGGGYDFFRGVDGTATTDDPTFNGSAGGLSTGEYFAFDGGDWFTYDTTNETWMQNLHKDNSKFTILAWIWCNGFATGAGIFGGTEGNIGSVGVDLAVSTSAVLQTRVRNGTGANALSDNTVATVPSGAWTFVGASVDEAVGANGGFSVINGTQALFNSTFSSPSSSNATVTYQIGARGNNNFPMPSGNRIAFFAVWEGVALTSAQVQSIYEATDTLAANAGSFALTRVDASFKTTVPAAAASYVFTGQAAALVGRMNAAVGTYSETSQAALFSFNFATAAASYALTGNAVALTPTANAGTGSYALTGIAATFTDTLAAAARNYAISWQTFSDNETIAANAGAFAFTGNDVYLSYDIDLGGVGSSISGGTFSRGRWRELKELEAAARQRAERDRERIETQAREAAAQKAAEERAAIAARRRLEDETNARLASERALADALQASSGLSGMSDGGVVNAILQAAQRAELERTAAAQEEEEAIVHLLLVA
jgi:hypothetical protein